MKLIPLVKQGLVKYKSIVSNFSYLSIIQIVNLILPIVIYPFLIRKLGQNIYGQIVYAQAIVTYLVVFINFGFNITATREISIHRDKQKKLNQIVNSIFQIKGILFVLSMLMLSLYLFLTDAKSADYMLYYFTMWMCLYEFIFPVWYFQGLEKMKFISISTVLSRLLFLALIFVFIKGPEDFLKVPIINGLGTIISCVLAVYLLSKDGIKIKFQKLNVLLFYLKKSYLMAIAFGANTFKANFNLVVVRYFFSFSVVAYFDLALKIVNIGITFLDLISQSIYPKMSKTKDTRFLKKVLIGSFLAACFITVLMQIFAPFIIRILGGQQMGEAVYLLRILAVILPIYIVGALLGRNCLNIFGYDSYVLKSMIFSSVVYLLIILSFSWFFKDMSSSFIGIAFILSFLYESIYRYYKCKSLKLL